MQIAKLAVFLALLAGAAAHADEYREPQGFNGHSWGQGLSTFRGLTLWQANAVAGTAGKVTDFRLECERDPVTGANCSPIYSTVYQWVEGEGSLAVGEYYFDRDTNPWAAQRIKLFAITYLFCASSKGDYIPQPVKKYMQLCGTRVLFHSDTLAALSTHDDKYESNFDRIMRELIVEYGLPPGYKRRGRILLEGEEQAAATSVKPEYSHYRWCGVDQSGQALRPTCGATVTVAFDATRGEGTILYATGPLYDYAYAMHEKGDENNELYVLFGDRSPDTKYRREEHVCTGSRICTRKSVPMTAQQLRDFAP